MEYRPVYCKIDERKNIRRLAVYRVRIGTSTIVPVCEIHKLELMEKAVSIMDIEYAEGVV